MTIKAATAKPVKMEKKSKKTRVFTKKIEEEEVIEKESKLKWDKLSDEHIEAYQRHINDSLDHLRSSVLCNNCHCKSAECKNAIQNRYNTSVDFLMGEIHVII